MSVLTKQVKMPKLPSLGRPSLKRPSMRLHAPSRRVASLTGLEIGATQAIIAEGRLQGGRIVAQRVAARPLPLGLLRDGLVIDPDGLATELRALFAEHNFAKRVRVGLATPRTVLRVIDLPPLADKDIRTALMMVAQERIPMPLERAVMDYRTVGLVDTPDGRRLRVIVVVTEKEGVEQLVAALRLAGLKPEGIDLSIFAVIRALGGINVAEGPVLYAQLGDLVNIAIEQDGVCRFTRQAPQGLALVVERLAEMRAIPSVEALELLQGAGMPAPGVASESDEDIVSLLSRLAIELGSELRAAGEFYSTQAGNAVVASGVVTGALALLPGFVEALAAASGLPLTCGEVSASAEALGGVDARLAPVAVGLTVAEVGS